MALDLADIALVLKPSGGPALDVIDRQVQECGSEHVAFLDRKRSRAQAPVLYEADPCFATTFTKPVLILRHSRRQYRFGSFMDSGDSNIILPFDFVRSEQFEIHLDTQDLKASIRFCNGKTLLDGKAFAKGAMADLKDGQKIEIEDIKFKVITTSAPAATDSNSGPKKDVSAEQQGSKLKGETMVNIRTLGTLTSPKKDAMFNALPSQAIQQDSERVAKRPSPTMPVAHAETTAFLESISKQPTYSPLKPITLTPQKRLDSPTDGGSSTVLECLPKLEDYRRGGFVGKGSHGQVFKHQSRHSQEVFAVKVIIFPKVRPAGRGDTEAEMVAAFVRQMAYIQREADILLKTNHRFVLRANQVFRYPEGLAIVTPYFEDGELGSLAEYPPRGKTWPLPLSDARSISGQILSGIEYFHSLGYVHRDLKPANVLLRNLDPLEVVICDHGFAQESSRATTHGGSRVWSAPECLWGKAGLKYGVSVDMYSMGVIVLWLREVYAEDGEYTNERVYNELFGDNIRKAINSSNSLEDTIALTIGQIMAAYYPPQRPTIEQCWESDFFGYWEPPPVKEGLDHTTAFESKEVGPNVDTEVSPDDSGAVESIHKAKNRPTSGQVKMRTTSVLAQTSKGPASFGVQQPARVQKNRSKVPISNKLLDALSRTSLTEDT